MSQTEDYCQSRTTGNSHAIKSRNSEIKNTFNKNLSKSFDNTDSNEVLLLKTKSFNSNESQNTTNKRQTKPKKWFKKNKKRKNSNTRSGSESSSAYQLPKACFHCNSLEHLYKNCPALQQTNYMNAYNEIDSKRGQSQELYYDLRSNVSSNKSIENEIDSKEKSYFSISTIVYYIVLGFFIFLLLNVIYMQYI